MRQEFYSVILPNSYDYKKNSIYLAAQNIERCKKQIVYILNVDGWKIIPNSQFLKYYHKKYRSIWNLVKVRLDFEICKHD